MPVDVVNGHDSVYLEILVVGAGLGGLAAAISCSLAGHRVTVLEAAPKLGEVGAGIQLTPNITRLLRRWGLFPALDPVAVQPHNIWFRRWETGEPIGLTPLVPHFENDFGAPYWVVHRAHLHQALLDRATQLGTTVHINARIIDVDLENANLTTWDGVKYSGDLILGCDGLKSVTRAELLKGSDPGPKESPFCAYRSTVPIEFLKSDPDLAQLVELPELNVWIGEGRHVMSYPINDGKTFNMVLSHPDDGGTPTTDPQELLKEMKGNYDGWDPRLTKIISLITSTNKWKLMTYPRLKTWRHSGGRFVLTGDACHAMLPYMSQGAAQAMEDAAAIGRCLARARNPQDVPALTEAYEKIRMDRSYEVQAKSALNGRIWHYPDGDAQIKRDDGMAASLSNQHYVRSTNQWSDPPTQIWLYNHDAETAADEFLDARYSRKEEAAKKDVSGIKEMIRSGLLAPGPV